MEAGHRGRRGRGRTRRRSRRRGVAWAAAGAGDEMERSGEGKVRGEGRDPLNFLALGQSDKNGFGRIVDGKIEYRFLYKSSTL